ncbi:Salicylate carboxymethyltransferase, partial [Mucuna pruriens]
MSFDQTHRRTKAKDPTSERDSKKQKTIMEVGKVLRMNGGVGDASYANNSFLQFMSWLEWIVIQQKVLCLTKGIREEAIRSLYYSRVPGRLGIADLGCSSGPNTFFVVSE